MDKTVKRPSPLTTKGQRDSAGRTGVPLPSPAEERGEKQLSRTNEKAKKYGNEKPISLHPLKPEEALRRAMSVPPPRKRRPQDKKPGEKL